MNLEEINVLKDWVSLQSEFNKNDLLVTVDPENTVPFSFILDLNKIQKTINYSQNSIKESGINPLCCTRGILNWSYQSTEICTPIFIIPTKFTVDKVRKLVELSPQEEEKIINPFLVKKLAQLFQLELPVLEQESELVDFLKQKGLGDIDVEKCYVGNFHHHRFALLKDLELIIEKQQLSENLVHYISGSKPNFTTISFPNQAILNYDADHREAFQYIAQENCVIQGPPGTGKSQLLTNLVAKSLASQKTQLVVSEKRSALEVIEKRLALRNLNTFAILVNDGINSHEFLSAVKTTWEAVDNFQPSLKKELSTFKALSDNLQLTLDILGQEELIGGINFTQFNQLKSEVDLSNFEFLSEVPNLRIYQQSISKVKELYSNNLQQALSKIAVSNLSCDTLLKLSDELETLKSEIKKLQHLADTLSPNAIESIQYKAVILQLFDTEIARKHLKILQPESKIQVQFKKQYEKYYAVKKAIASKENQLTHWLQLPSDLEIISLKEQFEISSIFTKIRRNRRWKTLSALPVSKALEALNELAEFRKLELKLSQVEQKLLTLGIEELAELPQINASIALFSAEKWEVYEQISNTTKVDIPLITSSLDKIKHALKHVFKLEPTSSILQQLTVIEEKLPQLIASKHLLEAITPEIHLAISKGSDFKAYQQNIIGTHQSIFSSHYPTFSNFDFGDLNTKLDKILVEETKDQQLFALEIWGKIKQEFEAYHTLLNTPSSKLTSTEKQLKRDLKVGKSILVKEFSKSRQHPTIRELLSSEAAPWIHLLKPIWLTNPVQLAKTHELDCEPFDLCIIDEASQILVENAVGSVARSKRIVIAGDQQQMRPTNYFRSGTKDFVSALQHASYQYKNIQLRHHYRSKHAPLITFSNTNFYNQQLHVFPSYPIATNCITRHFCPDGEFIERRNIAEAKKVKDLISDALKHSKTIGVVAFSQEQLDEIWINLDSNSKNQLTALIECNKAFFKTLEKVQGDECEHLIISLAYGKDEHDRFQQRFGPLNQENGKNRLNVLLSRASEKIDFVCSIASSDLKWSTNSSIELLYKWLHQIENPSLATKTISLPANIIIEDTSNKMLITDTLFQYKDALELKTSYEVFRSRGWEIEFK